MSDLLAGHHYVELAHVPPPGTGGRPRQADPVAWFREFVKEMREKYAELPEASRRGVVRLDDFRPPCQVVVFWVSQPERQFLFVTKEESMPDLAVEVHGPLPIGQALDEIGRTLQEPWLQRSFRADGEDRTYHDELERDLVGLVRMLQYEVFHPEIANAGSVIKRGREDREGFTWLVVGDLTVADPKELALRISQGWRELEAKSAHVAGAPPAPPEPPLLRGYCTYVLPPTWFGTLPRLDYSQKLYGVPVLPTMEFQTLSRYRGALLGLGTLGQIGIGEPDKRTCLRYMNEIMSVASLLGLPMMSVHESDLGELEMTGEGQIRSMEYPGSEGRREVSQVEFGGADEATLRGFREVEPARFAQIVSTAERVIDSRAKSDCAILLVEARTLAEGGQCAQSFLSSWSAIEKYFREVYQSRRPGRPSRARMNVGEVLRELHAESVLADEQFDVLERLRKRRNEISHGDASTSPEEAIECYAQCALVVGRYLGVLR